ncbi:MAG: (2Fe-2S)-binding protein [Desulfobacterales bacterium]|nr:MAG: (2Fe-2S)-binding protein [Desulfobacterales bacterium]
MVALLVNDREIEAKNGTNVLQACLDNDIYIPHLCYLESLDLPSASCRMCFVEIAGEDKPATSCTTLVRDHMVIKTDTPAVRRLQRTALRLLLSVHRVDCKNCYAHKRCELQNIAKFLKVGLKSKPLNRYLKDTDIDEDHPFLNYYPNRCVLCGKCLHVCRNQHGQSVLTFANRGFNTVMSLYAAAEAPSPSCEDCARCVDICPVGALALKVNQEASIHHPTEK